MRRYTLARFGVPGTVQSRAAGVEGAVLRSTQSGGFSSLRIGRRQSSESGVISPGGRMQYRTSPEELVPATFEEVYPV